MINKYIVPKSTIDKLTVVDVGEETDAVIKHSPPRQSFRCVIHFVVEGEGVFKRTTSAINTEDKLYKNCAFAIFENDTVFYESLQNNPLHYFWVGFSGPESVNIMQYIGFMQEQPIIYFTHVENIIEAFNSLFTAFHDGNIYDLFSKFYNLISVLKRNVLSQIESNLIKTDNEIFIKAEQYIKANIDNNISVQDVANAIHLNRSHFSRIFKKRFLVSPHIFINKLRLSKVEHLLLTTNYTLQQIADILNYADEYALIKQFKRIYKASPKEYRKKFFNKK